MFNPNAAKFIKLTSCDYMGGYRRVKWNDVVAHVTSQEGDSVTTDPTRWHLDTPGYTDIFSMWKNGNFNPAAIKWTNYYPNDHFDNNVTKQVCKYLRITPHRSWISRIDPGFIAPWHWDVDDNEAEYLKQGEILRYSIFIEESAPGQILILGEDYLFNQKEGAIVKWNSPREWHCGINASMKPALMFHVLGYR